MTTYMIKTSDEKIVEVPDYFIQMSTTLKNMVDVIPDSTKDNIPLPCITAATLNEVLSYCIRHKDDEPKKDDVIEHLDKNSLFKIILASDFLDIKSLLDVACSHVADLIRNKTPEEIRETFTIEKDFTSEEESLIKNDNLWS